MNGGPQRGALDLESTSGNPWTRGERGSPIMGWSKGQSAYLLISILMSQPRQQLVISSHSYKPAVIVES